MKCPDPNCGTVESKVKKTLIRVEQMGGPAGFIFGDLKMRIRECLGCGLRFNTYEVQEATFGKIPKAKTISEGKTKVTTGVLPVRRPLKTNLDLRRDLVDD